MTHSFPSHSVCGKWARHDEHALPVAFITHPPRSQITYQHHLQESPAFFENSPAVSGATEAAPPPLTFLPLITSYLSMGDTIVTHEFFKLNYRLCGDLFFSAMSETLKQFLRNNWRMESGFMAVLHTWGRALNWHPHLHVLAGAGGMDLDTGGWREEGPDYLFNVFAMSTVFRAIFLRELEAIASDPAVKWPERLDTMEARRSWRVDLAGRNWNIFVRPTLNNTRAVVRYLARYTSRIAMSNSRITRVDPVQRTVTFDWKDYRHGGRNREMTMDGGTFLRCFTRHLVLKGFRWVSGHSLRRYD
jgi:hypothetical protein